MGLFNNPRQKLPASPPVTESQIPIAQIDLSKRYDIYCADAIHDQLYENVRFVGIRTFDRVSEYSSGLLGGFLELEAVDGSRWLIPSFGIQLICEHGAQPMFSVRRQRRSARDLDRFG